MSLRVVNDEETYVTEACRRCSLAPRHPWHLGYCTNCWSEIAQVIGPGTYPPSMIHEMAALYAPYKPREGST